MNKLTVEELNELQKNIKIRDYSQEIVSYLLLLSNLCGRKRSKSLVEVAKIVREIEDESVDIIRKFIE